MIGSTDFLRSAKSISQPVAGSTSPRTAISPRNEWPCMRRHLWPSGTFGSQWAASNRKSFTSSTKCDCIAQRRTQWAALLLPTQSMSAAPMNDDYRSLGQIFKDLSADLSTLFRSEVALLKLEIKDTVAKLGGGTAMFAGAVFLGLFGLAFLFVTIVLGLVALVVAAARLALIVTVVLFAAAAVLAIMGKKKFAAVEFVPTESVKHIQNDIESIKADFARARSR